MLNRVYITEPITDGMRYVLPPRDLGSYRHFGWALILFGLVGVAFMLMWISIPAAAAFQMLGQQNMAGLLLVLFATFGLLGLYPTAKIFLLGIFVVLNKTQCVVELRRNTLTCIEKLGFLNWGRSCNTKKIQRFELKQASQTVDHDDDNVSAPFANSDWLAIRAIGPKSSGFVIAPAYPRAVIESLVKDLAAELDRERVGGHAPVEWGAADSGSSAIVKPIEVVDRSQDEELDEIVYEKPVDTNIQVHDRQGQLAYEVPPAGVWKGSKGLFFFSLLWFGIVGAITVGMVAGFISDQSGFWEVVGALAFMAIFWLAGGVMLVAALNMGTRSVMIGVLDDQLFIQRTSMFGKKWLEYRRDDIADIVVGPSGMEVNDRPVMELQIHTQSAKRQGLLSQLTRDELHWLASQLRQAFQITNNKNPINTARSTTKNAEPVAPESTDIQVQNTYRELTMAVPPLGMGKSTGLFIGGLALAVTAVCVGWFFGSDLFVLMIAATMLVIGLAMVGGWIVYISRKFEIHADATRLLVNRSDRFSKKQFEIAARDIAWIDIQPSGTKVNNVDVMQLTIAQKSGEKMSLMFGRAHQDIAYVAALLNERLLQREEIVNESDPGSQQAVAERI